MKSANKYIFSFGWACLLICFVSIINSTANAGEIWIQEQDTINHSSNDTAIILPFPYKSEFVEPFNTRFFHPLFLNNPSNIKSRIIYNPETKQYIFLSQMGNLNYRNPSYKNFNEYQHYALKESVADYWKEKMLTSSSDRRGGIIPAIHLGGEVLDLIFGGSTIDIRPQGSAELTFGVLANNRKDETLDVRSRRTVNFDFKEKIQMSVQANIGDKMKFKTNYNTESTFDFENKLDLKYEGKEDEIVKLIEAGDITFPLPTTLITGSQSLFGIKTRLQFGRATITSVFSQQESQTSSISVQGGAQTNEFSLTALDYEENRHFFLGQYFREELTGSDGKPSNRYNEALKNLPIIASNVNITRMEVWVTNIGPAVTNNRNLIAFSDLGEYDANNRFINPESGGHLPSNLSNDLLTRIETTQIRDINTVTNYLKSDPLNTGQSDYFTSGEDFEKIESARKLNSSEYTFNSKLGFISLNNTINSDQTLAVAYQYTVIGENKVYQVGEFSDQGINAPEVLIVKMLKSTSVNTQNKMWNLMMKNVYSLRAYQINPEDFIFNILYSGNKNGIPTAYLTEGNENIKGVSLIRLMNMDNLNPQLNPPPDGIFDFIDNAETNGGTIQSSNGRIFFPVLEPFGKDLRKLFDDLDLANKYSYDSLYTLTKTGAEQYPEKNKFILEGFYKSSSSNEISLNAINVPQGSVVVTAGGIPLTENVDYTVDYTLGRVRIINEGILNSGTPVKISLESNSMFNLQTKRMMGTHINYALRDNTNIGATIINLNERPLTEKTNYGDDPVSNTIWGFNFNVEEKSRLLTKLVDKLPFISTKTESVINIGGEFAQFMPGHSRAIGKIGTSYIDDFEGSTSTIELKNLGAWLLSSTPQGQYDLFPEAAPNEGLNYGKNRAKMAWYIIDPLLYDQKNSSKPANVDNNELSRNSVREILETEVFPNKELSQGDHPPNIPTLDMAFYPSEKGPYNYDVSPSGSFTSGINNEGKLNDPESRWAGIMRKIESTDFEATNVEYIEFWMMDPFTEDGDNKGKLYFNLGDISEDILRDSRKSFEHGLPTSDVITNVDTTIWGRVPTLQSLVETFDNQTGSRKYQDVGYDGLSDEDERSFFNQTTDLHGYLNSIEDLFGSNSLAFNNALIDPSSDNYHYFRGTDYDNDNKYSSILERYKNFNNPEGNSVSPSSDQNLESYPTAATARPNIEDINYDNTLSEAERYFQYEVDLDRTKMIIGENYITDIYESTSHKLPNGNIKSIKWYQFKIPVNQPDKVIGNIQDFKSIRFMRIIMSGFQRPIVLRFATLELVRGEW
ncbi:MAG: cell surface protein SprA, partial [Bacteroidetes bacterium]|nr:cell surface protein SprA [Bacteroidota bacterium]